MNAQFASLVHLMIPTDLQPYGTVSTHNGAHEGIKYRIYVPKRGQDSSAQDRLPVGVFYHGGGFALGDLDTEDALCRAVAQNSKTLIVSVDYRLAPDHKAPAQLEDAVKMFQWVCGPGLDSGALARELLMAFTSQAYRHAPTFGGDPKKLYTVGTSAGGALAFAVARKVVLGQAALPKDAVKGIAAFSPVLFHPEGVPDTYSSQHTAYKDNKENVPIIDVTTLNDFWDSCNLKADDKDYFVGLDQACHALLPPSYIVTCGLDPLRDDGLVIADLMRIQGIQVKSDHYAGLPHCFWIFPRLPETGAFVQNVCRGVSWVIENF